MYKTESTLGLIGNILGIIAIALILIVSLLVGALFSAAADVASDYGLEAADVALDVTVGAGIGVIILGLALAIISVVLGFIGTGKLKKNDRNGGILLIIAGALGVVSLFTGGWYGVAMIVLYFVGGIMALTKKAPTPQA